MGLAITPLFQMYFMTFFPNGEYCFQVAEMTTPCRFGLDEVDLLVEINNQACDICGFPLCNDDPNGWTCDCEDNDGTGGKHEPIRC